MKLPANPLKDSPTIVVIAIAGGAFLIAIILAVLTVFYKNQAAPLGIVQFPESLGIAPSSITAKAAIVYDPVEKKVLFAKNADTPLPLASLTKLMTAQTVLGLQQDTQSVSITANDLSPEGDWGFLPGDVWRLRDLLRFGLVASANDAMAAAAAAASPHIIDEMNRTAGSLGLSQTYFLNPTGLDVDPETAGAYGSAYDMAVLASTFLGQYPTLFEATTQSSVTIQSGATILHASSTDTPILDIPGLIAAKTGYTDLAGGNLVAIFDIEIGRPVVIAVLGSTKEARFSDVRTLIDAVRTPPIR
ncbi:D-alanyl-D-alanine carboxypeptidase [Acetobacteraceae bacterium]|nr:D-alanyl-D-alanine carboxypeptidase [Candidatus Parcubacteria bacterium]